ncbi:thioredoxin-1 [Diutina catenulata]
MVQVVSSNEEFAKIIQGSGLTVVDFYAVWCGPCKAIAPVLDQFASQLPNVTFIKVDVDQSGDIAREYQVSAMPTFKLFKNGKEVGELVGADPNRLRQLIEANK